MRDKPYRVRLAAAPQSPNGDGLDRHRASIEAAQHAHLRQFQLTELRRDAIACATQLERLAKDLQNEVRSITQVPPSADPVERAAFDARQIVLAAEERVAALQLGSTITFSDIQSLEMPNLAQASIVIQALGRRLQGQL